ncbi:MAG TPA: hypothetical protein VIK04_10700 [Solirubrobacteraceae bacterium]
MKASHMTKVLGHLKSNAVAYLALFVALGGTGYAAVRIPRGSVGTTQLKNHSVTPIKLARGSIAGYVRAYAQINADGQITSARPAAKVILWQTSSPLQGGTIKWSQSIPRSCFAVATTTTLSPGGSSASAVLAGGGESDALTYVTLSAPEQGVNVAIICPQP